MSSFGPNYQLAGVVDRARGLKHTLGRAAGWSFGKNETPLRRFSEFHALLAVMLDRSPSADTAVSQ